MLYVCFVLTYLHDDDVVGAADDQLSSLDLVAENDQEANTLVSLLNRLVELCQDERMVRQTDRHVCACRTCAQTRACLPSVGPIDDGR